jgi:hypothetical protein
MRMRSRTRRSLDALLAIGPHSLDAQLHAVTAYADSTNHFLEVCWAILPGEDAATDAPDSGFPIVAFDDEIAGFTPEEFAFSASVEDAQASATTDWHVAHEVRQPKRPTSHLPVYGCALEYETAADAILCVGPESLDRQIARIEAYAIRSAVRLRGVYIASGERNLRVLLQDFSASNQAFGTGPTLSVGAVGEVIVHD